jgi:hypothetical protein
MDLPEDLPAVLESFRGPVPDGRPPHARRLVTSRITRFLPGQYLVWVPGPRCTGRVWFSLRDALLASRVAKELADAVMFGDIRDGRELVVADADLVLSERRFGRVPVRWLTPGAPHVELSPEIARTMADDRVGVLLPKVPRVADLFAAAAAFFEALAGFDGRLPAQLADGVARKSFEVLATTWSGVTGEARDTVVRGPDGKRLGPTVRRFEIGRRHLATLAAVDDVINAVDEPQLAVDTDLAQALRSVSWPSELIRLLERYDVDIAQLVTGDGDVVLTDAQRDVYRRSSY